MPRLVRSTPRKILSRIEALGTIRRAPMKILVSSPGKHHRSRLTDVTHQHDLPASSHGTDTIDALEELGYLPEEITEMLTNGSAAAA